MDRCSGAPVLMLIAVGCISCEAPNDAGPVRSEISRIGDTTVVMNRGDPGADRSGEVRVIWRSPVLENPEALLHLDGRLIVGDRKKLHILTQRGEYRRAIGREGQGPGEFRFITAISEVGDDTVAVQDGLNHRISFLTPDGDHLRSLHLTPPTPFTNPVNATDRGGPAKGLIPLDGGFLSVWRSGTYGDGSRPTRTALVWLDPAADTSTVLGVWDGERWMTEGASMVPTILYGPRVISALGSDGRFAVGHGIEYCIEVRIVGRHVLDRRVCRDRDPAPIGEGIRSPDLSRVESERRRQALEELTRRQQVAPHLPHFDRMLFDEEGRLWVRTIGAAFSEISPYLLRDHPELEPTHRAWDVFDEDGRLLASIEVPSNLEPQVITAQEMYGFVELPTGEIAVGAATIPDLADFPVPE